jgi:hypothetical protein
MFILSNDVRCPHVCKMEGNVKDQRPKLVNKMENILRSTHLIWILKSTVSMRLMLFVLKTDH